MKLSGVMLGSQDSKKLADFYTKVLGEPGWHDGEWYGYQKDANLLIGPHSEVKGSNKEPARIMVSFETDDVEGEFTRIKELGATIIAEPYSPNKDNPEMLLATFADPDGNYIQLASPWE